MNAALYVGERRIVVGVGRVRGIVNIGLKTEMKVGNGNV